MTATEGKDYVSTVPILLGGAFAGLISDSIVHPVDTIRARLQVQSHAAAQYRSATHAFSQIVKGEGPLALYRGFSVVAVGTMPGHALYFAGYEMSKAYLNKWYNNSKDDSIVIHLTSGLVADAVSSLLWTPIDVIKQRLQVQKVSDQHKYRNSFHALRVIVAEEGIRGLFRGIGASIAVYGPGVAIYFALYERIKLLAASDKLLHTQDVYKLPFYVYLLGSVIASTISAGLTCPLDVIKTRVQVQEKLPSGNYQYKNGIDAFKQIVQTEGASALFQGIKPRCLWITGGTALTMLVYEEVRKLVHSTIE